MNDPTPISDCVAVSELLPELALGTLSGTERADVLAHLDRCAACRERSADWAAMVDVFPTLLGEAEPPAGFEARTLERLKADRSKVARRPRLQRVLAVAAIVAAAVIVSVAAVRIIDARGGSGSSDTDVASANMVGNGGRYAGDAFTTSGHDRYVFVDVNFGAKSGMYRIEAVDAKDRVTALGRLAVSGGHGAWAGELPASGGHDALAMVRLVDSSGAVLCAARFPTT